MKKPNWHELFMTMAYLVAMRSNDTSTHSGCVITTRDNVLLSTGYNSLPRGVEIDREEKRLSRENGEKYYWFEHAERNAIYNAVRNNINIKDGTLYVNWMPCMDCARAIVQSGIHMVIVHNQGQNAYESRSENNTWEGDHQRVNQLFREAGVWFYRYNIKIIGDVDIFLSGKHFKLDEMDTMRKNADA